ncbi:unannotated protein [freshwater metagenome]|uniref:(d)CMP kinase n=1 Tax=freshwater metagenome TaxID=449393 RepID=A0A6J7IG74_9ZZZZ|nr:(d)CMP kinase [Actinomycetota bacterium]MSW35972.1 (d)CMP kinase [Actinomycetota bacterium]
MSTTSTAIITVDGPSGSGKSSVSRAVARQFGLHYLDTGAMYRALTWAALRHGIDLTDADAIAATADSVQLAWSTDPDESWIRVDDVDVSRAIREQPVTSAVSTVSAEPRTRAVLVALQRRAVSDALAQQRGIVVEGRDIGSVVLPEADLKVWLVADPEVRAARRAAEDVAEGRADAGPGAVPPSGASTSTSTSISTRTSTGTAPAAGMAGSAAPSVAADLARRDAADAGRTASPAMRAHDAVIVDATELTLAEVVAKVVALVRERVGP